MHNIISSLLLALLLPLFSMPVYGQGDWTDDLAPGVSLFSAVSFRRLPQVRDLAISPDGEYAYFTVMDSSGSAAIWEMHRLGRSWSSAKQADFSSAHHDSEPFFSPDGQRLYFTSHRLEHEGDTHADANLWFLTRTKDGWSKPRCLPKPVNGSGDESCPSVAASGNIYFAATRAEGMGEQDIYVARWQGGKYQEPVPLLGGVNTPSDESHAYVAPDESFLIFSSNQPDNSEGEADLYYSFRQPDGTWSEAIHLPTPINSSSQDHCPTLDPQGQTLYFTRREGDGSKLYQTNFAYLMEMMR